MINKAVLTIPISLLMSFATLGQQTQAQLTQTMKLLETQYDSIAENLIQSTTSLQLTENLIHQNGKIDTNDIHFLCDLPTSYTLEQIETLTNNYIHACDQYIDTILEHNIINSEILGLKNKVQHFRDEIQGLFSLYSVQERKIASSIDKLVLSMSQEFTKPQLKELFITNEWCNEEELYYQISLQLKLLDHFTSRENFPIRIGENNDDIEQVFSTQKQYYERLYQKVGEFLTVKGTK